MAETPDGAAEVKRLTDEVLAEMSPAIARSAREAAAALATKDDLLLPLLKFHLLSERVLEQLILAELKRGDRLISSGRLSFSQKLALVHAFDVVDDAGVQALRHINALRNRLAHVQGTEISVADVDRIGSPLGAQYRDIKREHGREVRELFTYTAGKVYELFITAVFRHDALERVQQRFKK